MPWLQPNDFRYLKSRQRFNARQIVGQGIIVKEDFLDLRQLPLDVFHFLDDVLDELGTRKEVEYAFYILQNGSSADRQLAVFKRTGDLRAVVDQLIVETAEGVVVPAAAPTRTDERPIAFRPVSEVEVPIGAEASGESGSGVVLDARD